MATTPKTATRFVPVKKITEELKSYTTTTRIARMKYHDAEEKTHRAELRYANAFLKEMKFRKKLLQNGIKIKDIGDMATINHNIQKAEEKIEKLKFKLSA